MNWRLGCPVMIALGCVGIALLSLFFRSCDNQTVVSAHYATHADAVADEAVRRFPEYIPHSATNIQASHNYHTVEQWMRFDCDPADLPTMTSQLTPVSVKDVQFPWPRAMHIREWWPKELGKPTPNTVALYDLYTDTEITYVAIEKERPRVWLWSRGLRG
jgi:hypothetical protein